MNDLLNAINGYLSNKSIADRINLSVYLGGYNRCRISLVACDVADRVLHDLYPNDTHWVWSFDQQIEVYSEDSQIKFDKIHKKVMDCIQEVLNPVES